MTTPTILGLNPNSTSSKSDTKSQETMPFDTDEQRSSQSIATSPDIVNNDSDESDSDDSSSGSMKIIFPDDYDNYELNRSLNVSPVSPALPVDDNEEAGGKTARGRTGVRKVRKKLIRISRSIFCSTSKSKKKKGQSRCSNVFPNDGTSQANDRVVKTHQTRASLKCQQQNIGDATSVADLAKGQSQSNSNVRSDKQTSASSSISDHVSIVFNNIPLTFQAGIAFDRIYILMKLETH